MNNKDYYKFHNMLHIYNKIIILIIILSCLFLYFGIKIVPEIFIMSIFISTFILYLIRPIPSIIIKKKREGFCNICRK